MENNFNYIAEQFGDIRILRYTVDAFNSLSLKEKLFIYHMSKAALAGRDILWDQNNIHNLAIRKVLCKIWEEYPENRSSEQFKEFEIYTKRVLFANGIHHHYSMDKFTPGFTEEWFNNAWKMVQGNPEELNQIRRAIFDKEYMAKRVVLGDTDDLVTASANNYYQGVTQKETEDFYAKIEVDETSPISKGLNSTLVKRDGKIFEEVWHIGGKYSKEIQEICTHLKNAIEYAHNDEQKHLLELLIEYYTTGNLKTFDEFSIAWLKEQSAPIDFINGFIEVYGDPLGLKASWESVIEIVDKEACKRTETLAANAEWFEHNAPTDPKYKKERVSGVTARVMQVAMLGGDCHPATPIGINLPNAEWIRERYGSKSVTLDNITYAYDQASKASGGTLEEFAASQAEIDLCKEYGSLGSTLHTDLHECLGHGSGKLMPGVSGEALKSYGSTIEEARADLFALYYIMDPKLVELGLIPSLKVGEAEYCSYIRNGLMGQLTRIKPGCNLEESHMRNRQLIALWAYEHGKEQKIIEKIENNGKTAFVINDFQALRGLFAQLLAEVQRIKSEGDYTAAAQLVEQYGVKVDQALLSEVLERYEKLGIAPYAGFINPEYTLLFSGEGSGKGSGEDSPTIIDVAISYPENFMEQQLSYNKRGS